MKSCFVAIIGRPSAGKSTILNALCGEKVSITSPVPQTTRNKIRGIVNTSEGQLVFIDTPGYHHSDKKLNLVLRDLVHSSLADAEVVLYVVDNSRAPGQEEKEVAELLSGSGKPVVIALNKMDIIPAYEAEIRELIKEKIPEAPVIKTTATEEKGLKELEVRLFNAAPEGEPLYPDDYYTDQDPGFRIAEIIREKAIAKVRQEIPHSIYIEIADMEMRGGTENTQRLWVRAFLCVEKESQKGFLIGHEGVTIKNIRQESQKDLNRIFPYRIHLDLRVKVNPKWRQKDNLIKNLFR